MKKKIDTSISVFKSLINDGNLYIDKTEYLYNLITQGGTYFFCARPRRFGKTLAVYTLESIFKGEKELFKNLYIGKTDYDFKEYPIIHIDFGSCQKSNGKETIEWINSRLNNIANDYGISYKPTSSYDINLENLVKGLSKKGKVVVLIDEYDKPLSSNIYNSEVEGIRDVLRGFFEVLKALSGMVRFVFITGVTKYAKVSIFSSMNNLIDISMDEKYANMFGYTQEELEENFNDYIDEGVMSTKLDREEYLARLKKKYDGYCFSPDTETIYNPISIGQFFFKGGKKFDNYWADTGGNTKLLMDIAKRVNFDIAKDIEKPIDTQMISTYDIVEMAGAETNPTLLKSLLFQSGYLTIKGTTGWEGRDLLLDYPNDEVRESFTTNLLSVYIGSSARQNFMPYQLLPYFYSGDTEGAINVLKSIYASIPNENRKNLNESAYHMAFYCMMRAIGADIDAEVSTNKGRIDAVLSIAKHVYIIEFKYEKSAEEALEQIKDKAYYEAYETFKMAGFVVHLVGLGFANYNISSQVEEILL